MKTNFPGKNRSRRDWLRAAGALALLPAAVRAARTAVEERAVSGFDEVIFAAAGELDIVQAPREWLSIEAEPAILKKITSEVHGRQLVLAFAAGEVIAREPIRFRLEMPGLRALELQSSGNVHLGAFEVQSLALRLAGSGDIRLDRLQARSLVLRLSGSGSISIAQGQVDSQRIEIAGAGTVDAAGLSSESAEVSITGSGDARLAASKQLRVSIAGSGNVRYSGQPRLAQSITGAGTIEHE